MSARVESTPVRESSWRPVVIAMVAALGLGTLAVGTVRIAFDDDAPATVASVQSRLWDAQKLEAMEGRVLAEQVGSPRWDAQKLEAMEGRALAEVATVGAVVPALEPGELKAILEGQGLAEQAIARAAVPALEPGELKAILEGHGPVTQVGDADAIVPHVPRRTPHE